MMDRQRDVAGRGCPPYPALTGDPYRHPPWRLRSRPSATTPGADRQVSCGLRWGEVFDRCMVMWRPMLATLGGVQVTTTAPQPLATRQGTSRFESARRTMPVRLRFAAVSIALLALVVGLVAALAVAERQSSTSAAWQSAEPLMVTAQAIDTLSRTRTRPRRPRSFRAGSNRRRSRVATRPTSRRPRPTSPLRHGKQAPTERSPRASKRSPRTSRSMPASSKRPTSTSVRGSIQSQRPTWPRQTTSCGSRSCPPRRRSTGRRSSG